MSNPMHYDNDTSERMVEARAAARAALGDLTLTPEDRVAKVMAIFPGGTTDRGPSEWVEAAMLARELQEKSAIVNCGACFAPESCIAYQRCKRV